MANIITIDEYKSYNNLKRPDDDAKLTFLAGAVSNLIKAYTGSSFSNDPITEIQTLDYDTNVIFTNQFPVRDISDITIIGGVSPYPYDSTVHWPYTIGTDYTVVGDAIYFNSGFWPLAPRAIQITYTAGYGVVGSIPEDLKLAAIQLMGYYANDEYKQTRTIDSSTIVNNVSKDPDFPPHIRAILDQYRG